MAKILLVEDDNNLREIYGERLLAEGYDIVSASDGEEALQTAVTEKPDLIISDVMMPKISGFDMLDILRQTPETKNVKIIMMTALSQAEDKSRADKLGADKYLVKSQVTLEDVARVVHDILGDNPMVDQAADSALEATIEPTPTELPAPVPTGPTVVEQPVAPAPTTEVVAEPFLATPPPLPTQPVASPEPVAEPAIAPEPVTPTPIPVQPLVTPEPVAQATMAPAEPMTTPDPVSLSPTPAIIPDPTTSNDLSQTTSTPITMPEVTATESQQSEAPSFATITPAYPTESTIVSESPVAQPEPATTPPTPPSEPNYNPIAASVTDPAPSDPSSAAVVTNGNLGSESVADEMAEVQHQIEEFVANNNANVAEHQEPVQEPSTQDVIHAENAQEGPTVVSAAPQVDPTIPPIIQTQLDASRNPEPAQVRKKIISPVSSDGGLNTPDIHALYEEEMAKEAAITATTQDPIGGTVIEGQSALENPIAGTQEITPPPLETIDASQITGMTDPDELAAQDALQQATQNLQSQPTEVADPQPTTNPADPNDPNNFAL